MQILESKHIFNYEIFNKFSEQSTIHKNADYHLNTAD